jgi:mannose-1-phosphate guanylyltransferase
LKAFLLAAGLGTRLKPMTDDIPKCLVPICGTPLIYIWLELIENAGIDEVLISTHHFADKVRDKILQRKNKVKIKFYHESVLLGSGGSIAKNYDFVKNEDNFYILYADNLTNVKLKEIWEYHSKIDSIFTVYVYETDKPKEKGIFVANENGKAERFEEKPENPESNLANSGIGVANKKIFDYFNNNLYIDFGKDVMTKFIDRMYIMKTHDYIKDIGTMKDYWDAQTEWNRLNK